MPLKNKTADTMTGMNNTANAVMNTLANPIRYGLAYCNAPCFLIVGSSVEEGGGQFLQL